MKNSLKKALHSTDFQVDRKSGEANKPLQLASNGAWTPPHSIPCWQNSNPAQKKKDAFTDKQQAPDFELYLKDRFRTRFFQKRL